MFRPSKPARGRVKKAMEWDGLVMGCYKDMEIIMVFSMNCFSPELAHGYDVHESVLMIHPREVHGKGL